MTSLIPTMHHMVPVSWIMLASLIIKSFIFQDHPKFLNTSHILTKNWTLFIHNHIEEDTLDPVNLPKTLWDVVETVSIWYLVLVVWISSLMVIIVCLGFKLYIVS